MNIPYPEGQYIKKIDVNDNGLEVRFAKKQKIALLFICLNDRYWPYLAQVMADSRKNFLPQHQVDYFVWTDYNYLSKEKLLASLDTAVKQYEDVPVAQKQEVLNTILNSFANIVRLYELFFPAEVSKAVKYLEEQGMIFKRDPEKYWIESVRHIGMGDLLLFVKKAKDVLQHSFTEMEAQLKGATVIETGAAEWPTPTLMRYHLFLSQEEKLREYDHVFYLDSDMRVVDKISDEVLSGGLLAAEHPMYSMRKEYIPPYEPNDQSTAYIQRPGRVVDEEGKPRFKPYYYAGGFQGGKATDFIAAMHAMKANIDKDFDNNYTAIWNDESHWNKYLFDYRGELVVLPPSYVYPDSLVKEYYEKIWGRSYEPKIITLTKPFSLSSQGAAELRKFMDQK